MSFWEMANGRPHDLVPDPDPSLAKAVAPNLLMVPAAIATTAASIFALGYGYPSVGSMININFRVWRHAVGSISDLPEVSREHARGLLAAQRRRIQQGLNYYHRVTQLNSNDAIAWVNKGIAAAALGEDSTALTCFDTAVELSPTLTRAVELKAMLYLDREKHADAIAAFDIALEIEPQNVEIFSSDQLDLSDRKTIRLVFRLESQAS